MPLTHATGADDLAFPISKNEWNAVVNRSLEMPSLSDYGTVEDGADISSALTAAIADSVSNNTSELRIPAGSFTIPSSLTVNAGELTIHADGAKISSPMTSNTGLFVVEESDVAFVGLATELTAATTSTHHYRVNADNCTVHRCDMNYTTDQDTPAFYVRDADGFTMTGCRKRGSNAFIGYYEGSDGLIANNRIYGTAGGDDFLALKAINRASENISIIGNYVYRHASLASMGSQIGTNAAADSTYSKAIRNVIIEGNTIEEGAYGLYIKPGAIDADYRNGLVEGVVFSNNILVDRAGAKFQSLVRIALGRGSWVRQIKGENNIAIARTYEAGEANGLKRVFVIAGANLGDACTIEDIRVGVIYLDPYNGAANSGSAPGHPLVNIASIENSNSNGITANRIRLVLEANGCTQTGIDIATGFNGAVFIDRAWLRNINTSATGAAKGIRTASSGVTLGDIAVTMSSGSVTGTTGSGSFIGRIATQADSTAADVAGLKTDLNALLAKLRSAYLMV